MITEERCQEIYKNLQIFDLMVYFADYIKDYNFFKVWEIARSFLFNEYSLKYLKNKIYLQLLAKVTAKFNNLIVPLINANIIKEVSKRNFKVIKKEKVSIDEIRDAIINEYVNNNGKVKENNKSGNGSIMFEQRIRSTSQLQKWVSFYITVPKKEVINKHNLQKDEKVRIIIERFD